MEVPSGQITSPHPPLPADCANQRDQRQNHPNDIPSITSKICCEINVADNSNLWHNQRKRGEICSEHSQSSSLKEPGVGSTGLCFIPASESAGPFRRRSDRLLGMPKLTAPDTTVQAKARFSTSATHSTRILKDSLKYLRIFRTVQTKRLPIFHRQPFFRISDDAYRRRFAAQSLTSSVIRIAQKFGPHMEQKCAFFILSLGSVASWKARAFSGSNPMLN